MQKTPASTDARNGMQAGTGAQPERRTGGTLGPQARREVGGTAGASGERGAAGACGGAAADGRRAVDDSPDMSGPTPPEHFLPLGSLHAHLADLVGLACMLAWAELLFCFEGVLRDKVELAGGLVHDPVLRTASLVAAALFALAALAGSGRLGASARTTPVKAHASIQAPTPEDPASPAGAHRKDRESRGASGADGRHRSHILPLVACAMGVAGSAGATLLAGLWPTAPAALPCLCGAGVAAFIVWGTLCWGARLAGRDLRETLLLVSGAACAQWLPFLVVPMTPAALQAVCMAALAVGASVPLRHAGSLPAPVFGRGDARRCQGAEHPDEDEGAPGRQARRREPRTGGRLGALAGMAFAFSLVIEFVWCFFIKLLPGRLGTGLFPAVFTCVVAATALVMVGCLVKMERQRGYRLELYYRLMMLFCLCGVTATGVAAPGDSAAQQFCMYVLVYLGYSLSGPTLWLLALGYAHMRQASPVRVLGCVFACKYLGLFCGFGAVDLMVAAGASDAVGPALVPGAVLVCTAVLGLAYLTVFPERDLLSLSPLLFGLTSESLGRRCRQIAAEHCLTPRETEVFTLLARGRDVGYVCEELCISRNTANAHRKAIYAKLGVHSQQELLDAVEEPRGGE